MSFLIEIIINLLAISASFEYLCYGSMAIRKCVFLSARGPSLDVRIWRLKTVPALKGLRVEGSFWSSFSVCCPVRIVHIAWDICKHMSALTWPMTPKSSGYETLLLFFRWRVRIYWPISRRTDFSSLYFVLLRGIPFPLDRIKSSILFPWLPREIAAIWGILRNYSWNLSVFLPFSWFCASSLSGQKSIR